MRARLAVLVLRELTRIVPSVAPTSAPQWPPLIDTKADAPP
ncbi:MAG: hypothetical protein U0Z44_11350 [Kouleothrix sp.]